jgi:raffinose/stachyose/melibiose transport system substrate-binding protein
VLNAYFETGFDIPFKLSDEFTKQFPNVTWKISQDQFTNLTNSTPRLLASDTPPDLIRLPTMISLVKDGLLMNLDKYVTAFGWDKWPASELLQDRVATDGTRGSGSLYAAGLNYSMTGVFYNKKLAAQIGMTTPPTTVDEFEALLAKAKAAGLQPIMQWNASASGGGLAFPLQNLMAAYGPTQPINDWIFQKKGATIDTATNLTAAQHLETWVKNGYFPKEVNAIEYTASNSRFTGKTRPWIRTPQATSGSLRSPLPQRAAHSPPCLPRSRTASPPRRRMPTVRPSSSTGWRPTRPPARSTWLSAAPTPVVLLTSRFHRLLPAP